jgi:dTDP-4-dehydrorhamnose reductase
MNVASEIEPDVVVVCSAWPYVDGCERDPARSHRENVETVRNLVDAFQGRQPLIVFYSTDHVFDGSKQGARYVESDATNPPSVYARHKREVEELLIARGNALIVRTAWVFGAELRKKNFVYRVIELARTDGTLNAPREQAGCPTWSGWLCESTLRLLEEGQRGIVHLAGARAFTKAEWARTIVQCLKLPSLEIRETDAANGKRWSRSQWKPFCAKSASTCSSCERRRHAVARRLQDTRAARWRS